MKKCKSGGGSIDALRKKTEGKPAVIAAAKKRASGGSCNSVGATVSSPFSGASKVSSRGK